MGQLVGQLAGLLVDACAAAALAVAALAFLPELLGVKSVAVHASLGCMQVGPDCRIEGEVAVALQRMHGCSKVAVAAKMVASMARQVP